MKAPKGNWLWLGLAAVAIAGCNNDQSPSQPAKTSEVETVQSEPEQPAFKRYSASEFFQTTTVFGTSINHDASAVLVSSDSTGVFNAYRYPIDGGEPEQLTNSTTDTIYGVSWFPNDDRIIYTADQGGNELNHLYVRELDGTSQDLTPGEELKASFVRWQVDGKAFFALSNERDPKGFDLYRYDSESYERALVYQNDDNWSVEDVSPDGRWVALHQTVSNTDSNIHLVDLTSADPSPKLVTEHQGSANFGTYTFTPDSSKLIYGSNAEGEFNQAWQLDLTSGDRSLFYSASWDVGFVYFSKDGRYRIVGINQDAQTKLDIAEVASGKAIELPELPAGDLRGFNFSNDGTKVAFYVNSDTSPSNLYSYRMGEAAIKRLSNTLNPEIEEANLVKSEVRRFKSFDDLEVPGLLYKPKGASAENKVPALLFVHGGPGGQSRKGYSALKQHLVNHGYALFAVNNRGSSGYGKTFYHLDDKKHGEDDLQDIVYGKKYLQTLDWIDADRIGIMGGSYGGYMTMAGMAFTDEFAVGVNIFGVTNWVRTLTSIPPWWESFKKYLYDEMGDPAVDGDRHRKISPLFHAENIKKPVLVVQGANDPRVLQIESDEMVEAIRKNNVPVEYVLFPDEGHGFRKRANRITASDAYVKFLQQHL